MKGNEELLDQLHGLLTEELINKLKSGEATPADYSAVIRFLKDNDVTADINFNKGLQNLQEEVVVISELPFEVAEE